MSQPQAAAGSGTQEAGHVLEADAEGREFHKLVSCIISFTRPSLNIITLSKSSRLLMTPGLDSLGAVMEGLGEDGAVFILIVWVVTHTNTCARVQRIAHTKVDFTV